MKPQHVTVLVTFVALLVGLFGWFLGKYSRLLQDPSRPVERGWRYYRQHNLGEARREFEAERQRAPGSVNAGLGLGAVSYAEGKYDEATRHYSEALQKDPGNPTAASGSAGVYLRTGRLTEARNVMKEALKKHRNDASLHNAQGWVHFLSYDLRGAEKEFLEAIKLDKGEARFDNSPHAGLALTYMLWNKWEQAEMPVADGLKQNPNDASLLRALATLRANQRRFQEAHEALDKIESQKPGDILTRERRCYVHMHEQRWEMAETACREVLEKDPDYAFIYFQLGRVALGLADYDKGEKYLREAIRRHPKNLHAYKALGDLYLALGKTREAMEAYKRVTDVLSPDSVLCQQIRKALKTASSDGAGEGSP